MKGGDPIFFCNGIFLESYDEFFRIWIILWTFYGQYDPILNITDLTLNVQNKPRRQLGTLQYMYVNGKLRSMKFRGIHSSF